MKLLKGLGIALILFYAWVFIAVNFVTVGVNSKNTAQESTQQVENTRLKAEMKDAEILGKFWNDKGHFIVVYDEDTKAPELFQIDFSEWNLISVGDTY